MSEIFISKKDAFRKGAEDYLADKFYEDTPYKSKRLIIAWKKGWNDAMLHDKTRVFESIIDPKRKLFSPEIFDNPEDPSPTLNSDFKDDVLLMVEDYSVYGEVEDVLLCGSMASKFYDTDSDIDVTVIMVPNSEEDYKVARKQAIDNADKMFLKGSNHPINIYVRKDMKKDVWDNVYDILSDTWLKQTDIKLQDISSYFEYFASVLKSLDLTKEAIRRDIIDYNKLKRYVNEDSEYFEDRIQNKLKRINKKIASVVEFYDVLVDKRQELYDKEYSAEELEEMISVSSLPVSVLYKILEKYHYLKLLKAVHKLLKDEDEIPPESIDKLYKMVSFQESVKPLKTIYDKYVKHYNILKSVIDEIIDKDPTSDLKNGKAGYFSDWLIQAHINKCKTPQSGDCDYCGERIIDGECNCPPEDLDDRFYTCINEVPNLNTSYLDTYWKYKNIISKEFRDLYQYETFRDFKDMIDSLGLLDKKSKKDKQSVKDKVITIYKDKEWLLIKPLSPDANYYYSIHTKWCTTDPGTWDRYRCDSEYYILIKKEGDVKFAITNGEVWDEKDYELDIDEFMTWLDDVKAPNILWNWLDNYFSSWKDEKESENNTEESVDKLIDNFLNEITTTASVGAYQVPLGATPVGRKKRKRLKKKSVILKGIQHKRMI